jgi:biotin synthase-like enzyme
MSDKTPEQIETALRLDNLKTMQDEIHREHLSLQTVTIERIAKNVTSKLLEDGHFCTQERRITSMDVKLDLLLVNQKEIKDGLEKRLALYESTQQTHGENIVEIKNTIKVLSGVLGFVALIWTAGKVVFKQ